MQPKLSFVIPTRNCAVWLPHAVQSCRQQTENDIEIIVINDSSTDSTRDYLAWLIKEEPRAIVHHFDANLGRCAARNAGNAMAKAPIIAVLDADDIAYPNRAKLTLKKMETVDFAYGSAEVMGPLGNKLGTLSADVFNKDNALKTLENKIVHSTCAYHKRVIQTYKYSHVPEVSKLGIDDWEMQIRCALGGVKMDFIPTPIGAYRVTEAGISTTRDPAKVKEAKEAILKDLLAIA